MNTANLNAAPQQLSTTARVATALVVVTFLAAAWLSAGKASHEAVVANIGTLNTTRVTLQSVDIVAQRPVATQISAGTSATNEL